MKKYISALAVALVLSGCNDSNEGPMGNPEIHFHGAERFAIMEDSELFVHEPPPGMHRYTMIYLHGISGLGEKDWKDHIHPKTGGGFGDDVRIVIPQVKNTLRNPNREWFEFIQGREPWNDETPVGSLGKLESLEEAMNGLLSLVDREARLLNGDYSRIYIMGYSKGGQMAVWLGLMSNRPFGGIINYLGCLPYFEINSVSEAGKNVAIVHFHDPRDKIIQFRFAEAGVLVARRAGAIGYNGIIVSDVSGKDYHGLSSKLLSQIKQWFYHRRELF